MVHGVLTGVAYLTPASVAAALGLESTGSAVVALGLCCSEACGDLPGPGMEPVFPALAGGFFTTEPPRKLLCFLNASSASAVSVIRSSFSLIIFLIEVYHVSSFQNTKYWPFKFSEESPHCFSIVATPFYIPTGSSNICCVFFRGSVHVS